MSLTRAENRTIVEAMLVIPLKVLITTGDPFPRLDRGVIDASIEEQELIAGKALEIVAKLKHLREILPDDPNLVTPEEQP